MTTPREEFKEFISSLVDESKPALINAMSLIGIEDKVLAHGIGVEEPTVTNWRNQKEAIPLKMQFVVIAFLEQCLAYLEKTVLLDRRIELSSRFLSGKIFAMARFFLFDVDNDILGHSPEEIRNAVLQADKHLQTLIHKKKPIADTYPIRKWMN